MCDFSHIQDGSPERWFISEKSGVWCRHVFPGSFPLICSLYQILNSPNNSPASGVMAYFLHRQLSGRVARHAGVLGTKSMIQLGVRSLEVFVRNTRVEEAVSASTDRGCLPLPVIKSVLLLVSLSHRRDSMYNLLEISESELCVFCTISL